MRKKLWGWSRVQIEEEFWQFLKKSRWEKTPPNSWSKHVFTIFEMDKAVPKLGVFLFLKMFWWFLMDNQMMDGILGLPWMSPFEWCDVCILGRARCSSVCWIAAPARVVMCSKTFVLRTAFDEHDWLVHYWYRKEIHGLQEWQHRDCQEILLCRAGLWEF